jgi:hypothetical protein
MFGFQSDFRGKIAFEIEGYDFSFVVMALERS